MSFLLSKYYINISHVVLSFSKKKPKNKTPSTERKEAPSHLNKEMNNCSLQNTKEREIVY